MYIYSNTVFGQLLNFLPKDHFKAFVGQHRSDRYVKKLSTWGQLTIMLFAQASGKESLRDIELGLRSHPETWYHLGIGSCAKSTIAYANENRDYRTYESLFYSLFKRCQSVAVAYDIMDTSSMMNPMHPANFMSMNPINQISPISPTNWTNGNQPAASAVISDPSAERRTTNIVLAFCAIQASPLMMLLWVWRYGPKI